MHVSENTFRVRYAETDQMGIVYHSNYYIWFDMGRTEFMRSLGYEYGELEKQGVMLPILETHCTYKKPARYDDMVTVKTILAEMKGVRITFKYDVYNQNGELMAQGSTVQAVVNRAMKPVNLKKAAPKVYDAMLSALECCSIM
jgi:acyl-CoA thioester hydrolase